MPELEETSEDRLDHPLALRQIQLYLQDADRYFSSWFSPASGTGSNASAGSPDQHTT